MVNSLTLLPEQKTYEKDSSWANLTYRVTAANLTDSERDIIKAQTVLLEQFLKNKEYNKLWLILG